MNKASTRRGEPLSPLEWDRTMQGVEVRRTSYAKWKRISDYLACKARVLAEVSKWPLRRKVMSDSQTRMGDGTDETEQLNRRRIHASHDVMSQALKEPWFDEAQRAGRPVMRNGVLTYCCYGTYCEAGHTSDCRFAAIGAAKADTGASDER